MHYKVKKDSPTGLRFQDIEKKAVVSKKAVNDFLKKYGFKNYRPAYFSVMGGISSCVSPEVDLDPKIWGKGAEKGEYMPKRNSKLGRAIYQEIIDLPQVSKLELNMCIGYDEPWNNIGYAMTNESYFGFIINYNWGIDVPKDCIEITETEYHKLFNK